MILRGFPGGAEVKNLTANVGKARDRFDPWVGKVPWWRKWQPTPVFVPKKSHRQRSLEGYSPWGHKELDRIERLSTRTAIWREYSWKLPEF